MSKSKKPGVYAFCIVPFNQATELGTATLDGKERELFTIPFRDVSMVVCKAPLKIYKPNRNNLMSHQNTVSRLMDHHTLVPMSFGNVFRSQEDVRYLLEVLYDELNHLFPSLHNKIEVGLKIIGKKEWLESEIQLDQNVNDLKQKINGKSESPNLYDQIEMGELAKNFFEKLYEQMELEIYEPLLELAVAGKMNQVMGDRMLLNAAFLIDRGNEERFDLKVNELYEKFQDQVEFKYSGPWPPYNFINIKLKVEKNK